LKDRIARSTEPGKLFLGFLYDNIEENDTNRMLFISKFFFF
jgi:hypothetical protein